MSNPRSDSLPTNAKPFHYDLLIKTDLEKLHVNGYVAIHLDIENDTNSLTFNSAKILITSVSVDYPDVGVQQIDLSRLTFDKDLEQASLTLPTAIKKGTKAVLIIPFKYRMTNKSKGYYYSTYKIKGQDYRFSVTKFEPIAARRAFPCWDEPALKATFDISMISKESTDVFSNTWSIFDSKITSESTPGPHFFEDGIVDGWKITKFERTPAISTHLVQLANGTFKQFESSLVLSSGKTCPITVYPPKDFEGMLRYIAKDIKVAYLYVHSPSTWAYALSLLWYII
ncbi:hypothetical protein Clacol_004429 [Clathrus columnatus]|uniref:Aminopeptidase N-like N-terminal domain-containing protein n=1 Tax=Clathrus columnatus TaxID=1419009 RepID=A0AAV5A9Q2_9AGAM|nr:hypothetical protein Clacol_004429 [Clathrus columnatus]